jgi:hypothetical protein
MNIIRNQAKDFIQTDLDDSGEYRGFIDAIESQLRYYNRTSHRLEFSDTIRSLVKTAYDNHLIVCTRRESCEKNKYYQNVLFFLNNIIEDLEGNTEIGEFTTQTKQEFSEALNTILASLETLKNGQLATYDYLGEEFGEMREYFFMDKKTWKQMLLGKIGEMVAGGILSETVSKSILDLIEKKYTALIG